eukprot:11281-Heterocapsa_arctica.AAC.1
MIDEDAELPIIVEVAELGQERQETVHDVRRVWTREVVPLAKQRQQPIRAGALGADHEEDLVVFVERGAAVIPGL